MRGCGLFCCLGLLFGILCCSASSNFTIYVFDVGQADSSLVVFPSGYSILIDAGELGWNSAKNAKLIASKLRTLVGGHVSTIVVTHMHTDHMGDAGYGGIWYLIENEGITFDRLIDRSSGTWGDTNGDTVCDGEKEITYTSAGSIGGTTQSWLCYVTDSRNKKVYSKRVLAQMCSTTQIAPPDSSASVKIVAVNAWNVLDKKGKPVNADHTTESTPPSENDYSIGLVIRYGKFSYATFGDLDGEYSCAASYCYNDVETVVAPNVGAVDMYHVNHHGSSHSSNSNFINTLKPKASVISCGYNNSYSHPDQTVLNRLLASGSVFLTEKGNLANNYGSAVISNGDVKITTSDTGQSFTVTVASGASYSYTSRGSTAPTCST